MNGKMNVGELCTRSTVFGHGSMSVSEAARLMLEHHVGSLVIVDETDEGRVLMGMLTDRDIVVAVVARDFNAQTVRSADIMSRDLVTCHTEDSLDTALGHMQYHGVRRIPVVDEKNVLVGIITMDDLLGVVAENLQAFVEIVDSEHRRETHVRG
ncbi:MAG: CBS domain-containing protein [Herminiimonas sp.]|nr:CBS domain-containing protein [Herminiimonas sp.]